MGDEDPKPTKRQKKDQPVEEKRVVEQPNEEQATADADTIETTRLFVMNLSFQVTHEDLKKLFGQFGEIVNVEVPLRKGGKGEALGIAYITFQDTEGAITAFASLDKSFFQGRKLHIFPSQKKPPKKEEEETKRERKPKEEVEN